MTKELLQPCIDAKSAVHKHYLGQAMPDAVYQLFALVRDGVIPALAQQEQPASVDAYVGAREDAAIWKKRALEAEELNRKFIAELNGPTYLGEPAQQEQPAQEACWCDQNNIGEPGVSCGDCPTRDYKQPALTYEDLETCREVAGKTFRHHKSSIRGQQLSEWDDWEWHLAKAIEAHCRGGNHG